MIVFILVATSISVAFALFCISIHFLAKLDDFNNEDKRSSSYGAIAKLTWKQLKDFYRINPNRWRFEPIIKNDYNYVTTNYNVLLYNPENDWRKSYYNGERYEYSKKIIRIQLSFIDYLKFLWNLKYGAYLSPGQKLLLETVQKDIDVIKREANKQIDQANDAMKSIVENLKKETDLKL